MKDLSGSTPELWGVLFDPRPKSRGEELFGRGAELGKLHENVDVSITIITGVRRICKTSLLNVFLDEVYIPSIIVDLRSLGSNYGFKELYGLLSKAFASKLDKLLGILKSISSIKVVGGGIEIRWKGKGALTLPALFDGLNRRRVIVALDGAQRLRGSRLVEVLNVIVHAYNYDKNVTFILTGSEAGLLFGFLNIEAPASSLYARYCFRLNLERFGKSLSMKFLQLGFKEAGLDVNADIIEEVVEVKRTSIFPFVGSGYRLLYC